MKCPGMNEFERRRTYSIVGDRVLFQTNIARVYDVDIVGVTGSIPVLPTTSFPIQIKYMAWLASFEFEGVRPGYAKATRKSGKGILTHSRRVLSHEPLDHWSRRRTGK